MSPSPPRPDWNKTDWIVQVEDNLKRKASNDQQCWNKQSIYRVRACITDLNSKAYQPQVVSFGPYHYGKKHLLPMEEHKCRALFKFLERSGKPLKPFLESLREVAQDLEESYDALDLEWKVGSGEGVVLRFLELMITDGCFMLEILRVANQELTPAYEVNDPIFSNHGKLHVMPYIRRDMLMLENQLPMLVLDRLVAVESDGKKGHDFINRLILHFFYCHSKDVGKCLHVLDVYRKSLLFQEEKPKNEKSEKKDKSNKVPFKPCRETIRSATKLHEHGIWFSKSKSSSLKDISFARGVLSLPTIQVDDTTESVYLNLIAFEHLHVGAGNEVTSYIFLMDKIIDKEGDVALLDAQGIIQNALGSDKAVAELFNSLCKEVTLEPESSLDSVHKEVSDFCKKTWYTWIATLYHTYFRNPWSMLSVMAAILLFALAIIQTVYTVLHP
ncbi:hypothetical protein EUGRSUZ_J01672 [Eucalyptus grandis]|uniref:Uncharacterized protein n=2 Tax=Eucalyptus grandis TaxID=71139 RepID=A0A059AES6_EUCGR|nr:hypothetical protein EUGRSUZ_J01672 [Eucalyptus grandis]